MFLARYFIGGGFSIDAITPPVSSSARWERAVDVLLAISLLSWAAKWLYDFVADPQSRGGVTLTMAIFQAWVGALFLFRDPIARPGGMAATLLSTPSLFCSGLAFKLSAPAGAWRAIPTLIFASGAIFALVSLTFLGKSFAVLPARRKTVRRGPYRWIRHPAYAGELLMVFACALAAPGRFAVWIFPVALLLLVVRILAEEATLMADNEYLAYSAEVRWRLLPRIW